MNDPERPAFGASEVIEITSKLEADDNTFIIGGQATNFWAWFYQDKEPALKLKGPFTSADIDYFGTQECHSACNFDPLSRGIGVQN
jgi:hypothetical protein